MDGWKEGTKKKNNIDRTGQNNRKTERQNYRMTDRRMDGWNEQQTKYRTTD